jgi:hypothetical protein
LEWPGPVAPWHRTAASNSSPRVLRNKHFTRPQQRCAPERCGVHSRSSLSRCANLWLCSSISCLHELRIAFSPTFDRLTDDTAAVESNCSIYGTYLLLISTLLSYDEKKQNSQTCSKYTMWIILYHFPDCSCNAHAFVITLRMKTID